MTYYLLKIVVTTVLVVLVSEVAKRSSLAGAILASIPLVSVLAMFWLYLETGNTARVGTLSLDVFWLVLPSLTLFVSLPLFLKHGLGFYFSMGFSMLLTAGCYLLILFFLDRYSITF